MKFILFIALLAVFVSHIAGKATSNTVSTLLHSDSKECQQKHGVSLSTQKKLVLIRGGSSDEGLKSIDWRYFLAGGICAACSHGITTPIGM